MAFILRRRGETDIIKRLEFRFKRRFMNMYGFIDDDNGIIAEEYPTSEYKKFVDDETNVLESYIEEMIRLRAHSTLSTLLGLYIYIEDTFRSNGNYERYFEYTDPDRKQEMIDDLTYDKMEELERINIFYKDSYKKLLEKL
jgi:hypothetical protein